MAEPANQPDRAAMMKILLPAGAVAVVVVLVAVLWSMSGAGVTMSDGSNGSDNDPALVPAVEGVKYRDLREGNGDPVKRGDKVKVKYKGWLPNGTVIDSNDAGMEFDLGGAIIKGWSEGIPGMRPGGVRKLVIAPEAGYGAVDKGKIPPNSTLIFEILLISVSPAKNARPPKSEHPTTLSDGTAPGADDPKLIEVVPGLKYRDLKEGNGTKTHEGATVTIDYTGWLLNGQSFDSSLTRPQPYTSPLANLVAGWQKGIPGMRPGGIRKLVISPELGYANQKKQDIPPGSTLVFEVEMIEAR